MAISSAPIDLSLVTFDLFGPIYIFPKIGKGVKVSLITVSIGGLQQYVKFLLTPASDTVFYALYKTKSFETIFTGFRR